MSTMRSVLRLGVCVAIAAIAAFSSGAFAAEPVTKDEAMAMVKKAVAAIRSEGADKAYVEIDEDRSGAFVDRERLSHVPSARLDGFLTMATDAVAPNGRLLFVDEHADPRHEEWTDNPEIAIREMTDGSRHEIVKVFVKSEQLAARLDQLGWLVDFDVDQAWLIGSARRRSFCSSVQEDAAEDHPDREGVYLLRQ